jgi:hypothetical protein
MVVAIPAPIMARIVTPDGMMQKDSSMEGLECDRSTVRAQRLLDRKKWFWIRSIVCTDLRVLLTTKSIVEARILESY